MKKVFTSNLLCKNSGFSSVPAKMPKNANAALLAMSHAVHSFISLYICTLMAPGGWPYTKTVEIRYKNLLIVHQNEPSPPPQAVVLFEKKHWLFGTWGKLQIITH